MRPAVPLFSACTVHRREAKAVAVHPVPFPAMLNFIRRMKFQQHRAEARFVARVFPDLSIFSDGEVARLPRSISDGVDGCSNSWLIARVPCPFLLLLVDEEVAVAGEPVRPERLQRRGQTCDVFRFLPLGDLHSYAGNVVVMFRGYPCRRASCRTLGCPVRGLLWLPGERI